MSSTVPSASVTETETMTEIYRRFVDGQISRARAKDLLGDDWEETAQVVSMRRARESNQENGYSGEELSEMFA